MENIQSLFISADAFFIAANINYSKVLSFIHYPTYLLKEMKHFFKYRQKTNVATVLAESIMNSCPLIEGIDV